ncbi:unnamed protein product [Paramecium sonneborni]|uniref:Uncharacterized protein n=1 Tax=Paramecium sonneborni TaxID=65129 RepID=A0A8S1RE81_9CILI|nr:unnamed protein product [Paramecium sonneborni]
MGQMTEEDVAIMYNMGGGKKKEDLSDEDDEKISKDFEGLSMEQMMAKLSKLGNKQCFCKEGNIRNVTIIYIKELNNKKMKREEKESKKIDNINK